MKIKLHDPVVVAQAPFGLRQWGPWQFPNLQRLTDGRLLVGFHVEADSATAYGKLPGLAISEDEGETWREVEPGEEVSAYTEKVLQLPNGDLLRQVKRRSVDPQEMELALPPALGVSRGGYFNEIIVYDAESFPPELAGYRFARLKAGEREWQEEQAVVAVPNAIRTVYMGVLVFPWIQRIELAPDGSLWGINHAKRLIDGVIQDYYGALFVRSTDGGRRWEYLGEIPYRPDAAIDPLAENRDGFTEPHVAFLVDGSVLALLRTTDGNGVGPLYASRSTDDGRSWSEPALFDDLGVWPTLLALENGTTLAAYGRPGLYLRATDDPAGKVWEGRMEVVKATELQKDSCSYPDLLATAKGEALIAYSDFNYPDRDGRLRKSILVRKISVE